MFDYAGLPARQISRLCDRFFANKPLCKTYYWTAEVYSLGRYYREYANIPEWIPLFVYSQHGATYWGEIFGNDIENDAEALLVFTTDTLEKYKRVLTKPCYQITMPYVLHRRLHNIVPSPGAKGTLVFPCHSTFDDVVVFNIDEYVAQLRTLPPAFHPLCICVYAADVKKGLHLEFIKRGFPVYTAGCTEDVFFGDRLYSLMRQFKYTTSNDLGSYAYYSTEMGIPFSLFGNTVEYINMTNPYLPQGRLDMLSNARYKEEVDMFSGIHTRITPRQKECAEYVLGIGKGLSGEELRQILLDAYRKRRGNAVRDALKVCKRRVRRSCVQLAAGILDCIAP